VTPVFSQSFFQTIFDAINVLVSARSATSTTARFAVCGSRVQTTNSLWCSRRFTEAMDQFCLGNSATYLLAPYHFSAMSILTKPRSSFDNIFQVVLETQICDINTLKKMKISQTKRLIPKTFCVGDPNKLRCHMVCTILFHAVQVRGYFNILGGGHFLWTLSSHSGSG